MTEPLSPQAERPPIRPLTTGEVQALLDGREEALADLREEMTANFARGPGAILLRGIDPDIFGEGRFASALARIGGWLGSLAIQSLQGERVARVERKPGDPTARGTYSDTELRPHTDLHDILALACHRAAASGGESLLISARDFYAAVRNEAPDLLAVLLRPYVWGGNPALQSANRPRPRLPILFPPEAAHGAQVAYNGYFLRRGGEAATDVLARFDALAQRLADPTLFNLKPGDMLFWHNWGWLHGRMPFVDREDRPRLLFRLWIRSVIAPRADPALVELGRRMDEDHKITSQWEKTSP